MPSPIHNSNRPETIMAVFPQSARREDERVLTYATTSEQPDGSYPDQQCLILPIYGEITSIVHSPNPAATRQWLSSQRGMYQERWQDGVRRLPGRTSAAARTYPTGRYIVGLATTIEDIPATVRSLGRYVGEARHTPAMPDHLLGTLYNHYAEQAGIIPQFVVGIHARTPAGPEIKDPITIRYTQYSSLGHLATLPGLQYKGGEHLDTYTDRNHNLLLATNELNGIFGGAMSIQAATPISDRPPELPTAPLQFPLQIKDTRRGQSGSAKPVSAPNRDYVFDLLGVHGALRSAEKDLDHLSTYGSPDEDLSSRTYRANIRRTVILHLGSRGLMSHSNQPAINTDAYIQAGESAKTLDTSNLGD